MIVVDDWFESEMMQWVDLWVKWSMLLANAGVNAGVNDSQCDRDWAADIELSLSDAQLDVWLVHQTVNTHTTYLIYINKASCPPPYFPSLILSVTIIVSS